jgi:hypothetical protein
LPLCKAGSSGRPRMRPSPARERKQMGLGAVLEEFNHAKDSLAADGDVYCTIPQPLGSREVRLLLHLLRRPDTVKHLRARFEALREVLD